MEQTSDKIFDSINPKCGERVKELLRKNKKTQTWLADKLGITEVHLSNIVRGEKRLTEKRALEIVELFPTYRFEWLMGIDDYPTIEEKNLSDEKNSHIRDVINSMNKMQLYHNKIEALEKYFDYYNIDVFPPLGVLYSDETIDEAKSSRSRRDIDGIDIVSEDTLFVIMQYARADSWRCSDYKDDKDRIVGVCKGSELLEFADSLLEYAEFKVKKFLKRSQETLKENRDENGEKEVGNALDAGILSKDRYTTKQMMMYRDISQAYFKASNNSSIVYYGVKKEATE